MTINSAWAKILYDERREFKFRGRLLTIGRQSIEIKSETVKKKYRRLFKNSASAVTPEDYFRFLGFSDCQAIDISSKDGADIIQDLNQEIPGRLQNQFDFIIDGGTLEHCFDVKTAMSNIT